MFGIVVCSHAGVAQGIADAVEMIMGEQENFAAIGLYEQDSYDGMIARIKAALDGFSCEKTLILADLFGATPANAASVALFEHDACVLTGASLPMAIAALSHRTDADFDAFVDYVSDAAKREVRLITKKMIVDSAENG